MHWTPSTRDVRRTFTRHLNVPARLATADVLRRRSGRWLGVFAGALAAFAGACTPQTPDGGDGSTDGGGTGQDGSVLGVTAKIVAPSASFGVSVLDTQPVSVIYSVLGETNRVSSVVGFYVRVASASSDAGDLGDPIVIAPNLSTGENRNFGFDPRVPGVGFFRVGIRVAVTGASTPIDERSTGVIQVQGPPDPRFILPTESLTAVTQGEDVLVKFDAGDPEGVVQWRLFFLDSTDVLQGPADQFGMQLGQPGSGNAGEFVWSTAGLAAGDYRLGLSATDSGSSVAVTAQRGDDDKIVTVPSATTSTPTIRVVLPGQAQPPTINISRPGTADENLFLNQGFTIQFSGAVREPEATGRIDVFYDRDRNVTNGFNLISSDLPTTATSAAFPTNLPEGTYNIGATIDDGINAPVTTYAQGRAVVVRTVTLDVTDPKSTVSVRPGVNITVKWTTNAPAGNGTTEVVAQRIDSAGQPLGLEIKVLQNAPLSQKSVDFNSTTPGLFQFTVRLLLTGGTTEEDKAPANVRVTSLPAVLWLGSLATSTSPFAGTIFGGANFEDNAGTSFSTVGDLDGNGTDEFLISSRYGKPLFVNPDGVGPGEAYLVYNSTGSARLRGTFNLNSLGTNRLHGVTFAGVRTRQDNNQTDGMSLVGRWPDVDGDNKPELVFGFPDTKSRGHNVADDQDGFADPMSLPTLEREDQFLRGGIVIVSSRNSVVNDPTQGITSIFLDRVGQVFESHCVEAEPEPNGLIDAEFYRNVHGDTNATNPTQGCGGSCLVPQGGGKPDATNIDSGFVLALARDYFSTYVYSFEYLGAIRSCVAVEQFVNHECLNPARHTPPVAHEYCALFTSTCDPFSPGLHADAGDPGPFTFAIQPNPPTRHSGFYSRSSPTSDNNDDPIPNEPLEPLGARLIGVGIGDEFGTTMTLSTRPGSTTGDVIVSAPKRTARGILLGKFPPGCTTPPECGGEINGLESSTGVPKISTDSGVAYLFQARSLWTPDSNNNLPPRPHQYIVGEASHCSSQFPLIDNVRALRLAGFASDQITNIVGIDDYNGDGRDDLAIGAPNANGGQGRVYVGYRREPAIEGDYVLEKLARSPSDPGRLDGLLITTNGTDSFGSTLATGFDFNNDGFSDLAIGSPTAAGGVGEVLILFGSSDIISPENGISVTTLLSTRRATDGAPVAARLRGNRLDTNGQFGFNIANAGDLDGDGTNDLLIAAPNATPRFDDTPNDINDTLSTAGVDVNQDGRLDAVPGPDDLGAAGLVYVVYGKNRLDNVRTCSGSGFLCTANDQCGTGQVCSSGDVTVSIDQLGNAQLEGFIIAGRRSGDHLAGGDAGDPGPDGNPNKVNRGRSFGLASAGDVDGDGRADILVGSVLADPRRDPNTDVGVQNGGEAYLVYGSEAP